MSALIQPQIDSGIRTVSESDKPEVLADIYQELYNIVIWRRNFSSSFLNAVNELLSSDRLLQISQEVTPQSILREMRKELQNFECNYELSDNIAELVDMFCCLFDLKSAALRFVTLENTMCPRFHVDRVPCRLITTYLGSSTQWLPHHAADRSKLGAGNNGLPDELSGIYQRVEDIQQLTNGDVALLKGELWEGNENSGIVHRSPALKAGEKRLLLTLDFLS
jgi:hypothetical protein